jgi:hypothetical protein
MTERATLICSSPVLLQSSKLQASYSGVQNTEIQTPEENSQAREQQKWTSLPLPQVSEVEKQGPQSVPSPVCAVLGICLENAGMTRYV